MLSNYEKQLYSGGVTPTSQMQPQEGGFIHGLGDIARGIGYGATEAFRSTYNLVNVLDDFSTIDFMSPIKDPIVDAPETFLGQIAGGATQFFLPYTLFSKAARGVAGLGFLSKIPGAQGSASWFAGVKSPAVLEKIAQATANGNKYGGWSKLTSAVASTGSTAARSTLVDFVAFEGAGARLSEIVQANPKFANPLTEYLAGDEDDSELEGRFKNALEGFGLGLAFDTVAAWRRGSKGAAKAVEEGLPPNEVAAAFVRGTDESLEVVAERARVDRNADLASREAEPVSFVDEAGETVVGTVEEQVGKVNQMVSDLMDILDVTRRAEYLQKTFDADSLADKATNFTDEALKELGIKETADNLGWVTAGDGLTYLARAIEEQGHARGKGTVVTNPETLAKGIEKAAEFAGMGIDDGRAVIAKLSGKAAEDVQAAVTQVQAFRLISVVMAEKLLPAMQDVLRTPGWTWKEHATVVNAANSFIQVQNGIRAVTSEFGRALQSVSIKIDGDYARKALDEDFTFKPLDALNDYTEETFDAAASKQILNDMMGVMKSPNALDNLRALDEWNRMPLHRKVFSAASEYFINAILSPATTHVINTVSGGIMTFFRPIERMMGAKISAVLGDEAEVAVARQMYSGEAATISSMWADMGESWRMARQGGASPFVKNTRFDTNATFSPIRQSVSDMDDGLIKTLFEPIARLVTSPSKLMMAEDSAVKNWAGRGRFRAVYGQELAEMGVHPSEIPARVEEGLKSVYAARGTLREQTALAKAFRDAQALGGPVETLPDAAAGLVKMDDPSINALLKANDDAILRGKEVSFSTGLTQSGLGFAGHLGTSIQRKHPGNRIFLPFVRTPVNIAEFGFDRSVGAVLGTAAEGVRKMANLLPGVDIKLTEKGMFKLQRELASPDMAVRSEARMKMAYGMTLIGTIATGMSIESEEVDLPRFTGAGPSDPMARKALELSGWQPYSIRVGDSYVSYSRLDPFATLIGTAVDASNFIRESEDDEDTSIVTDIMLGLAVSAANNVTKKTYFQGLQGVLGAITKPEEEMGRLLRNTASGFIPGIVASVERTVDPDQQEARTLMDRMMSRIPGFSNNLDKRRNVLGEVIKIDAAAYQTFNPFRITEISDSIVHREMAQFSYGFRMPNTRRAGVDLLDPEWHDGKASAFDRWMEQSGTVRIHGRDLRQALRFEIKSGDYQRLSEEDGPNGELSPRISAINSIIRQYRSAAWNKVMRETPGLSAEVRTTTRERQQFKAGTLKFPTGN